jgi:hypothetical protein
MGNAIFGLDLAGIIADTLGDEVFDVTVTRETPGQRDPENLTGGLVPGTPLVFTGKGFWEDVSGTPKPGVEYTLTDRVAVLLGDTFDAGALPLILNDAVTVHEPIGDITLYAVQPLKRDPAAAVYQYLCRDRKAPTG